MCGIAGIISSNPTESNLLKMLEKQAHRGPDHTGTFMDQAKNLGINVSLQEKHLELGYRISPLFIARRHISIF